MSKVIVLSGPPACGKSTYAEDLRHTESNDDGAFALVVSSDEVRARINGDVNDQRGPEAVFAEVDHMVETYLTNEFTVIVDATNTSARNRASYVEAAQRHGVPVELHIFTTDVGLCLAANAARKRQVPDDVIIRMAQQRQDDIGRSLFDFLLEGFDSVHFVKRIGR